MNRTNPRPAWIKPGLFFALALLCLLPAAPLLAGDLTDEQKEKDPHIEAQIDKTGYYELDINALPSYLYFQTAESIVGLDNPKSILKLAKDKPWMVNGAQPAGEPDYRYRVWVPEDYRRDRPAGIVSYIPPSDHGFMHKTLTPAMLERNLIVIAPLNAGNTVDVPMRITRAIYAVELLKRRYAIDDNRVYISGSSGGGRAASIAMYHRPDLFVGGLPLFGANPIDNAPNPAKNDGSAFQGLDKMPSRDDFKQMARNRYAIVTGEKDYNKDNCQAVFNNLKKRGLNASFTVLPGVGHGLVHGGKNEHLAPVLDWLDAPLIKAALDEYKDAEQDLERNRFEDALTHYQNAHPYLSLSQDDAITAKAKAAQEQIAVLTKMYEDAVAALDKTIADKDAVGATESLRDLQRSWRDKLGREAANDYRKKISEIKRGG